MYHNIRTLKVGTFNLMNFMLPEKRVYGGTLFYTHDEYRRKSDWIRFMLDQMDADIIGFQELFHREALARVIKDHPKYRKARLYMAEETGDQPSVALLSRYPVENIEVYTHFPEEALVDFNPKGRERVVLPFTTFTRPVIRADIRIKEYGLITVFVVHLKSKREIFYAGESSENPVDEARAQSRSLMLRASESVALRAVVAKALEIPERPVILCGDVNDTGNAVTSRIISGDVPHHRLPDDVKSRIWDVLLYHVKDIQARRSYQDFYYTHIHNGMYEALDQIMVSQELVTEYPRNTGRVGLVSVYNDHLVDQTFTQHAADKCKSDHGVVVCSLELDLDRAAKYKHDDDGSYSSEELIDGDRALRHLDESRFEGEKHPKNDRRHETRRRDDRRTSENRQKDNDRENPHPSEGFNVQDSLDRWRKKNDRGSRQNNVRRSSLRHSSGRSPRDGRDTDRLRHDRNRNDDKVKSDVVVRSVSEDTEMPRPETAFVRKGHDSENAPEENLTVQNCETALSDGSSRTVRMQESGDACSEKTGGSRRHLFRCRRDAIVSDKKEEKTEVPKNGERDNAVKSEKSTSLISDRPAETLKITEFPKKSSEADEDRGRDSEERSGGIRHSRTHQKRAPIQ